MRPTYEKKENRRKELQAADVIRKLWWPDQRTQVQHLPVKSVLDLAFVRDSVILGFGEVKVRTNDHDRYPTYMLSLEKWMTGVALRKNLRLPVWLFVQFADQLMWAPFAHVEGIEVGMGGRYDRGDPQDVEPVALIPLSLFSVVEKDTSSEEESND